jgi:hypothetical protein
MALDSLGFGIGLQARPKDYAGIAQQALATRSARQKAEAAAKARNDEEFNKLITSKDFIQQSGNFHKLYRGAASKEIADFMNRAVQARKDNPNDYLSTVVSDFQQTQLKLNSYKDNSEKVKAYEKAAFDPKLNATTWFDPNFTSSVINESFGGPSDWYKVKATPGLGITFDPETGDFDAQPRMKITDDEVIKDLSDTKNMQEISAKLTPTPGGGGKFKTAEVVSQVRPEVMENRARLWSNNPDYVTSKAIEMGVDMSDPNWFSKTQPLVYENVKNLSGQTKTELSVMTVPSSGASGAETISAQAPTPVEVDVWETIRTVNPRSFLESGGPMSGGQWAPTWNTATQRINELRAAGNDDQADKEQALRDQQYRSRATLLYYYKKDRLGLEGMGPLMIQKGPMTDAEFTQLRKNSWAYNIDPNDLLDYYVTEYSGRTFSDIEKQALEKWVMETVETKSGDRVIETAINIDDRSRVANSDQDWAGEEGGRLKTVKGRVTSIETLDDGTMRVKIISSKTGKPIYFPYTKYMQKQISDKGYPQIKDVKLQ